MIYFLSSLSILAAGSIVYRNFRSRMGKYLKSRHGEEEIFNYNMLFRLLMLFSFIPFIPLIGLIPFMIIYDLNFLENRLQLVFIVFGQVMFSFGVGMYYVSITIEQFVVQRIKNMKEYKPFRLASRFFHGPASHTAIYMGLNFFLMGLCFFERFDFEEYSLIYLGLIFIGLGAGFVIGIQQRVNLTWRYQTPVFFVQFIIFIALILFNEMPLKNEFSIFIFFYFLGVLAYLIYKNIRALILKEENWYSEKFWKL